MGFFEGAYDFEVNGGNFFDIRGDQMNRTHDASLKVGGSQNKLNVEPDMSRQDNRTYNTWEEQAYAASYRGPSQGSPSTYPGYGQIPPTVAPMLPPGQSIPNSQGFDLQAVAQYQKWEEYWKFQQWMQYMQQQQQQQQQQQTSQTFSQGNLYQGPSQLSTVPPQQAATRRGHHSYQQGEEHSRASSDEQAPDRDEDEEVSGIRRKLATQHIDDQRESR